MVIARRYTAVLFIAFFSFGAWSEQVELSMTALMATNEGRTVKYIDPSLNKIRHAVEHLDYDTFKKLTATETSLTYGKETKLRINDRFTLGLTPEKKDSKGRVRVHAIIEAASSDGKRKKKALDSMLILAPGKPINLAIVGSEDGGLFVVLVAK